MAKVSLRNYNREIENLIEQNQLDEALAHCHHILKTFPKHLETYRLLGKVFLESKRYNEAVDIFNRILVSVPNDFVSHVGMSIINDDQNKLDNAIWHMERAFESQPSNAAIQGELQRLYGRRDGVVPPRIQMTRGALAHMYIQGELYSQAITEIQAVLQQDPQRADIQVLLAIAYFRSGQGADASDISGQLLKRYPYCLDANRIFVGLLPGGNRAENTQAYRMRIYELDPYAAFAKDSVFNSGAVADNAVNLERLDYSVQKDVPAGPDWSASLGAGLAPAVSSDQQPDWLMSAMPAAGVAAARSSEPAPTSQAQDDIPDFIRDAGWGESSGVSESSPSAFDSDSAVEEISPAELPDWMKAMAPSQTSQSADQPAEVSPFAASADGEQDVPDWLKGFGGNAQAQQPSSPGEVLPDWLSGQSGESQAVSQPASMDSTSAWLKNLDGNQPESAQPAASAEEMPGWLGGLDGNEPSAAAQPAASAEEMPGWLGGLEGNEPSVAAQPAASAEEMPGWLGGLEGNEPSAAAQPASSEEMPAWMSGPGDKEPSADVQHVPSVDTLGTSGKEQDDAVSWLESLASKHGAKPEELVTDPSSRSDVPPAWVDQARNIGQSQQPSAPETSKKPAVSPEALGTSAQEQDDAVSWLESLASKHGARPEELVTDPKSRSDVPPDWVDQASNIAQSQPPAPPLPQEPAAPPAAEQMSAIEKEETASWLESLESQDAAKPQEFAADLPSNGNIPLGGTDSAPDMAQSQSSPQDELDVWLRERDKDKIEAVDFFTPKDGGQKLSSEEDQETVDWLASLAAGSTSQPSGKDSPPSDASESLWSESIPKKSTPEKSTWEQSQEPMFEETSLKGAPASDDIPDWLNNLEGESQEPAAAAGEQPFSWLAAQEEKAGESQPGPEPVLPSDWHPVESPLEEAPSPTQTHKPPRPAPVPVQSKMSKSTPKSAAARSTTAAPRSMAAILTQAQEELSRGDIPSAMEHYGRLIKKGRFLDDAIRDLRDALYRYPIEVSIWRSLGDAYMRSNRLQEALDAYTKAEELLR